MYRLTTILLLLFSVYVSATAASHETLAIELKSNVSLDGPNYRMSDLAYIRGKDEEYVKQVKELLIGAVPRAGYKKKVKRDDIQRIITRATKIRPGQLSISGPDAVVVSLNAKEIPAEKYLEVAETSIYEYISKGHTNILLDVVGVYKPVHVPLAAEKIRIDINEAQQVKKRMSVIVEIYTGENLYAKLPVWFSVEAKAIVYRLKYDVFPGSIISEEMVQAEILDINEVPDNVVLDKARILGKQVTKKQHKNNVVVADFLSKPFDVVAGQIVNVKVISGAVTLMSRAIALDSGSKGKIIRLRNTSSQEVFSGKVVTRNIVECI